MRTIWVHMLLLSTLIGPLDARADDLSGRWVMVQSTTTVSSLPVVGELYATTRVVTVHDLVHDGDRLHGAGVLCSVDIDNDSSLVTTTIPDALKRALPVPPIDAILREIDGEIRLSQRRHTVVVGAKLARATRDALPTDKDDERVDDLDGDGKPGVTIAIGGIVSGEIYAVRRSWTALDGTAVGREGFSGRVRFGIEQRVLDATSSMLREPPAEAPVPARSWFRMGKLGKKKGCKSARAVAAKWIE